MPIVKAQCSNCGGKLEVDSSMEAAICPYCKMAYIVEKAINQYNTQNIYNIDKANINIAGIDKDSECKRALNHLRLGNTSQAMEVFENLISQYPDFWGGWYGRAIFQYDKGLAHFTKNLENAIQTSQNEVNDSLKYVLESERKRRESKNLLSKELAEYDRMIQSKRNEASRVTKMIEDCYDYLGVPRVMKGFDTQEVKAIKEIEFDFAAFYSFSIFIATFFMIISFFLSDDLLVGISIAEIIILISSPLSFYIRKKNHNKVACYKQLCKSISERNVVKPQLEDLIQKKEALQKEYDSLLKIKPNLLNIDDEYMNPFKVYLAQ